MMNEVATKISKPPIPTQECPKTTWGNLSDTGLSMALAELTALATNVVRSGVIVCLTEDSLTATRLAESVQFFLGEQAGTSAHHKIDILHFPDRETLPYDIFSPHQDLISERLLTLYRLPSLTRSILFVPIATAMHYLLPRDYLERISFVLAKGERLDPEAFRQRLVSAGYRAVSQVMEHGEFALRGSIIDLFPMGSQTPYRIDLFDIEVDSIRTFDPETQRSLDTVNHINLLPAREYPLTNEAITQFRQQWRATFPGNPANATIYQTVSDGNPASGIEYYLPLFYPQMHTLFDYFPEKSLIVKIGNVSQAADDFWQEVNERFTQRQIDYTRPLLPPEKLFLAANTFFQLSKEFLQLQINKHEVTLTAESYNFNNIACPTLPIHRKAEVPLEKLADFLTQHSDKRILFCVESPGRREALLALLHTIDIKPENSSGWHDFLNKKNHLAITLAPLNQGLIINDANIIIITENEIFGSQVLQTRRKRQDKRVETDAIIRDLMELNIGAPIVHLAHGVGRYMGLKTFKLGDVESEYLCIHYAGDDKLYVPVTSLHLISRYTGPDADHAPLNKLGSEQWAKARRKAAEKIRDVAAEILALHARRAAKSGFSYRQVDGHYLSFATAFPFEETPDQEKAIDEVFADMQSNKTMDRLICGDVGFGKTEVAMRAAFIAVINGKQVAMLVPTTLLAQQHYQTFIDRFADWPITVEMLSRFRSAKEQKAIIEKLTAKSIDIIIGTHKLLQQDIQFKDLGLLIIDEEHRFGVKQKERLKALRAEVDILALTATPIPRTLNMAMSGARDISIITTPPAKRLAIKTFVQERNDELIREAIMREIMRGGQIYYLHNEVKTIKRTAQELSNLVPEVKLAIAHGQMNERELEKVMADFYHHRVSLLLCTIIIESGIDIPTANTIIIERADKFGLAQLHQLRGRVGRSHHQAYAYLLIPPRKLITKDANKRLDALASLEDLGAGFMLATHDLEIRGAGEILGEEQSGHIHAIGFSLYMEMLGRAVKSLRAGKQMTDDLEKAYGAEVDIRIPALIPETYVHDVHLRLILYKRIANAKNNQDLDELQVEMIDRFGLLPQPAKNLFAMTELRLQATTLGIKKLEANSKSGNILFTETPRIAPDRLIQLIQSRPKEFKFSGPDKLCFAFLCEQQNNDLLVAVENILREIKPGTQAKKE